MKNIILNYNKIEVDDFIVSDYFSKKIHIIDFLSTHPELFVSFKVMDDEKLENISYKLYGTSDYWDLLLMINGMDPLVDMPYNSDTIINKVQTELNIYFYFTYSHAPLSNAARITELTSEFTTNAELLNEKFRYINVIRPSSISLLIKLLKDNKFI